MVVCLPKYFYEPQYNDKRRIIISLLFYCIDTWEQDVSPDISAQLVRKIERSCYNTAIDVSQRKNIYANWENSSFVMIYQQICSKITKHLDMYSEIQSTELIERVLGGDIDLKTIGELNAEELCPSKVQKIKQLIRQRLNAHIDMKISTMYRCSRCGQSKTQIREVQLRSLDESATLSITCTNCGYSWFNG